MFTSNTHKGIIETSNSSERGENGVISIELWLRDINSYYWRGISSNDIREFIKGRQIVMAYISSESVKQKRDAIKKALPDFKISVTKEHHSSINVSIMAGTLPIPIGKHANYRGEVYADNPKNQNVNQYHYKEHYAEFPEWVKVFDIIMDIVDEGNHDNSDVMTDYFDVGWYSNLQIGKWDKAYQYTPKEDKTALKDDPTWEVSTYKNYPVIALKNGQYETVMTIGKTKARVILANIDAIKKFVEGN